MPVGPFHEASFAETPIGGHVAPELHALMASLAQGRLALLTGAGVSAGEPTGLPSGKRLARLLIEWLESNGMGAVVAGVDRDDLGDVCAAFQSNLGRDALLVQIRASAEWDRAQPNLCHFAIAVLTAEGALQMSLTVNWDRKVRDASLEICGFTLDCPSDVDTLRTATPPTFVHLHGDIDKPQTLVATAADLTRPAAMAWTEPVLQAVLAQSDVALIGFASEARYVLDSIDAMTAALRGRRPLAVIADQDEADFVHDSPRLARAAGLGSGGALHQGSRLRRAW